MEALIFAIILFGTNIGGIMLPVIFGLLMPGRKGTMRTTQSHTYPNADINKLRSVYEARLKYEGFSVIYDEAYGHFKGGRISPHHHAGPHALHTHANKPLQYIMEFIPIPGAIEARLTLWTTDLVFMDTGEGRFIDQMIQHLLLADQATDTPDLVPNRSLHALSAVITSILILCSPVLLLLTGFESNLIYSISLAMILSSATPFVLSIVAIYQMKKKPGEITGKGHIIAACSLAALAVIVAAGIAVAGFLI